MIASTRRRALLGAGAAALALASPALAFPDRPLRVISGFNPGGANDIVPRALARPLSAVLGRPVAVENRAGRARRTQAAKPEPSAPGGLAAPQQPEREAHGAVVRALGISVEG